ncbi:MAG: hypothetical protein NTX00_00875 [Candidatus Parcubacteria bacterium]|nr:hypothetical protein [Candidatus Parcubacteria bacterium]
MNISCPEEKKIFEFLGKSEDYELTDEELKMVIDHRFKCPICDAILQKEMEELPEGYFDEMHQRTMKYIKDSVNKLPWRQKYSIKLRLFKNNLRSKLNKLLKMRYTA